MFVAWLHLLQSLQPDRIVLHERGATGREVRRQQRGPRFIKKRESLRGELNDIEMLP